MSGAQVASRRLTRDEKRRRGAFGFAQWVALAQMNGQQHSAIGSWRFQAEHKAVEGLRMKMNSTRSRTL